MLPSPRNLFVCFGTQTLWRKQTKQSDLFLFGFGFTFFLHKKREWKERSVKSNERKIKLNVVFPFFKGAKMKTALKVQLMNLKECINHISSIDVRAVMVTHVKFYATCILHFKWRVGGFPTLVVRSRPKLGCERLEKTVWKKGCLKQSSKGKESNRYVFAKQANRSLKPGYVDDLSPCLPSAKNRRARVNLFVVHHVFHLLTAVVILMSSCVFVLSSTWEYTYIISNEYLVHTFRGGSVACSRECMRTSWRSRPWYFVDRTCGS